MDNLRKGCIKLVDWCYMCRKSEEFIDHLLLHCEVASTLWDSIFNLLGLA
jgi:hypothetical protein